MLGMVALLPITKTFTKGYEGYRLELIGSARAKIRRPIEASARVGLFFADELPLLAMRQKPKAPPRKRERIAPPSLPLDYPPSVGDMLAGLG